ncbi:putative adhesin [Herbihabitans rhizosphaerae]|uniref:Putative adhesin n=1 Tax=Herbihabitans rhizosphaerae TaxID=1872711 RepID=A0A4Q7L6K0_9PSEU|nr:DUF4097 family beta strand repeat-containing protein [Herbihabitans rhizosphaerae]RZS44977.1 putative adhesin [Herbihabitans rhizosphaerae]
MPTFATPEPITTTLITAGARVRIAASERSDTVVLVEPVDSANKSDVKVAENTEVDFSAGTLSIKTKKSGTKSGSVAITIELPVGSNLVLHTAWSDVQADGPLGDCELHPASGRIQLDHVAGTADIDSSSATMWIGEVTGAVRYEGSTGTLRIDRAEGDVTVKAANCPIRIGRLTRGRAELTNASGGIEIGIGENTAASVDAKSTKGSVRDSLRAQDNPDDKVEVYARTRRDDIVIHRAAA